MYHTGSSRCYFLIPGVLALPFCGSTWSPGRFFELALELFLRARSVTGTQENSTATDSISYWLLIKNRSTVHFNYV